MDDTGRKLLTIAEVAARLQIHYDSARKLVRAGTIPSTRIGPRSPRVSEAQLAAYLRSRTVQP